MMPLPETIDSDEEDESQRFVSNVKGFFSPKHPELLSVVSLLLNMLNWVWFAAAFTAREPAWWTSSLWFFLLGVAAVILALRSIRNPVGIIALVVSFPALGLVCILCF